MAFSFDLAINIVIVEVIIDGNQQLNSVPLKTFTEACPIGRDQKRDLLFAPPGGTILGQAFSLTIEQSYGVRFRTLARICFYYNRFGGLVLSA
jgi:hypothetical protein